MFLFKKFSKFCKTPLAFYQKRNITQKEVSSNLYEITRIIRTKDEKFLIPMNNSFLPLEVLGTLMDCQQHLNKINENIGEIHLFNKDLNEYSMTTPVFHIIDDDFYLKIGNEIYFVLVKINPLIDPPKMKNEQDSLYLNAFLKELPCDTHEKETLNMISIAIFKSLQNSDKKLLGKSFIKNSIFDIINQISLKKKRELEFLNFKLKFLEEKMGILLKRKEQIDQNLNKKSRRRINFISSVIFAQILLIQYGTYYVFSWDIMEPITCLFGVIDVIIPYYFWMKHHKDYSFESMHQVFIEKKQGKFYQKNDSINAEIENLELIIKSLKMRKIFFTEKLDCLLKELFSVK